jgi:Zn-dependent alcohol dehydrogenase
MQGAWGGALPAVYGHEAAGIVESVGAGVTGFAVGDPVVVTLIRSCGSCAACSEGRPVFCETSFDAPTPIHSASGEALVQGMAVGAFAEHVVVHHSQAVVIPADIALDAASLIACGVITGMGAVINTADVRPGQSVVVIGAGGVGLNSVQGARLAGADPIIAIDLSESKLKAARAFGATHAINAAANDVVAAVAALTGGRRADFVLVTVGAKSAIEQALGLMRRAGAVVIVGMPASGVMNTFDAGSLAADGQRIMGSKMGSARIRVDIPRIVSLYREGRVKLDALISGRYRLEDINEAVASVVAGAALRNVIVFDGVRS